MGQLGGLARTTRVRVAQIEPPSEAPQASILTVVRQPP